MKVRLEGRIENFFDPDDGGRQKFISHITLFMNGNATSSLWSIDYETDWFGYADSDTVTDALEKMIQVIRDQAKRNPEAQCRDCPELLVEDYGARRGKCAACQAKKKGE